MSAATGSRPSDSFGSDAEVFMYDPPAFFDRSYTKQHSIARDRMEELQLAALALRFNQGLEQVAMVSKLAGRQGITRVSEFDDVVPLLFEHTMYKSYPLSLLERQQFDKLTSWVSKLTPLDLSAVDASECDSIDSWLAVLADKAELQITYTSGTSGTMSFLPVSRHDHRVRARVKRQAYLQTFGEPPSAVALDEPVHLIGGANRWYGAEAMRIEVARGQTSKLLPRQGVQAGRLAFFDLAANSHWGGLMTGDEIALDFDGPCECGATTLHFSSQVARLSEKRGGDKISCTATPQAYEEAMDFLVGS
jgi:hypothetical protein